MRVLLIQAPSVEGPHAEIVAPLGLGVVAAAARERGHEVEMLDLNLEIDPFPALPATLAGFDPQVVGIGLRNIDPLANRRHSFLPEFNALLEVVKKALPGAPVVVGGAGFSMFARPLMERYPLLDVGVVLEGEHTFPAVLGLLERGGVADVAGLPGTLVRLPAGAGVADEDRAGSGGRIVAGVARPWLAEGDLAGARRWLPDLARLYAHTTSYAPAAGVETKRGCPLRCSYCVYPALQGGRLRYRPPADIVEEVLLLHREAGAEWVHFTDPVLNFPADHFREVCRLLIERRVPVRWTGFFREDVLTPADARLAVEAGCAAFQFSGDGTCDRTLATMRKGLTRADLLAAAAAVADTEALSVYHFMVNVPGTDDTVVRDAHDLVERLHDIHSCRGNLGAVVFNNLRVYPGTGLAAMLREAGSLRPEDDLLFPYYHDPRPFRTLRYELEEHHRSRSASTTRPVSAAAAVRVGDDTVTMLEEVGRCDPAQS